MEMEARNTYKIRMLISCRYQVLSRPIQLNNSYLIIMSSYSFFDSFLLSYNSPSRLIAPGASLDKYGFYQSCTISAQQYYYFLLAHDGLIQQINQMRLNENIQCQVNHQLPAYQTQTRNHIFAKRLIEKVGLNQNKKEKTRENVSQICLRELNDLLVSTFCRHLEETIKMIAKSFQYLFLDVIVKPICLLNQKWLEREEFFRNIRIIILQRPFFCSLVVIWTCGSRRIKARLNDLQSMRISFRRL